MKILPPCAAAALLALTACDSGGVVDQAVRGGVRQAAVEACRGWAPQSEIAVAAGIDGDRLCGCAAGRILADMTASELAELSPSAAQVRAAVTQCVADIQKSQAR